MHSVESAHYSLITLKIKDSNIDVIPVHHITQTAAVSKARQQELRLATQCSLTQHWAAAVSKARQQELRLATQSDPTLGTLAKTIHKGWQQSKKDCPEQLLTFWSFRQEISEEDGLLYKNQRLICHTVKGWRLSKSYILDTMLLKKCNLGH